MKLSIVIPVYNVEQYIEKCLLSCVEQDISSDVYEIIVVNDGTPDNSMSIVRRIAQEYNNIHIIEQENQGLSAARNNGFAVARGEYVWFVDSDDWIENNSLKRIVNKLKNHIDILQLQYRLAYDDHTLNRDCYTSIDGIVTGEEQTLRGGLPAPAQFSIYRSGFLRDNGLSFVKGIYHEDSEFKPRVVYLAKKIASDDLVCYNYYQRTSGSITSTFSLKRAKDLLFVCNSLYKFSKELPSQIQQCINSQISLDLNTLLLGYHSLNCNEQKEIKTLLATNKHLFNCMMRSNSLKYKIEGLFFRLNTTLGLTLHKLIRFYLS